MLRCTNYNGNKALGYIAALHQITMGNRVPEVQSKIAMGIIGFVDDFRKHLDVEEKRLFFLTAAFCESPATVQEWCGKILAALRRCESMASRLTLNLLTHCSG